MNTILQSIRTHPTLWMMVFYIIASNAVNGMPMITDKSSNFYKWFFAFSHGILMQAGRFLNKGANGNASVN